MSKPQQHHRKPSQSGRTNLASCVVATIFLVFIVIVILIVFFTLFKPTDPKISVNSVQLPTFSVSNNSTTVNFTFSQYVSVKNPNRASFAHYDSTLQLLYAGNQVGFMFIPAGKINAGGTQYMAATFSVQSFPLGRAAEPENAGPVVVTGPGSSGFGAGPTMEIESRMQMAGRVRILHFFSHNVEAVSDCRVTVSVSDGSVLGYHC